MLAESFLLGLVGIGLGLAAGFEMTINANALVALVTGYRRPSFVPWPIIFAGVGIIAFISIAASIWPAVSATAPSRCHCSKRDAPRHTPDFRAAPHAPFRRGPERPRLSPTRKGSGTLSRLTLGSSVPHFEPKRGS